MHLVFTVVQDFLLIQIFDIDPAELLKVLYGVHVVLSFNKYSMCYDKTEVYDRLLTENAERRKAVKLLEVKTELFEGKIAKLYTQATFPCG